MARRRSEIVAAVDDDEVVVEDIPLLVESGMAPLFPLVVVVHAATEVRLARLISARGMSEADAVPDRRPGGRRTAKPRGRRLAGQLRH